MPAQPAATGPSRLHRLQSVIVAAVALSAVCAAFAANAASAAGTAPLNVTTGAALRPGVYGRIQVRGAPPPVVYNAPVTVTRVDGKGAEPVYLYVPPGQVRRWALHCAKWQACERPVYFVRVDDSPSKLGAWKKAQKRDPAVLAWNAFAPER
jgi:hypothetical protein